jgi:hypothetical protein
MNGSTISLGGSWVRTAGNIDNGTSVVELTNNFTQTLSPGATSFFGLTVNKTGGGVTLASNLDLNGGFTMQNGTFAPGARLIDVAGNWTNNGGTFRGFRGLNLPETSRGIPLSSMLSG